MIPPRSMLALLPIATVIPLAVHLGRVDKVEVRVLAVARATRVVHAAVRTRRVAATLADVKGLALVVLVVAVQATEALLGQPTAVARVTARSEPLAPWAALGEAKGSLGPAPGTSVNPPAQF